MQIIMFLIIFLTWMDCIAMENEKIPQLLIKKKITLYQPESLLHTLINYLVKNPEILERPEFDEFLKSDSQMRYRVVNLINNRRMCLQNLVINFLLKNRELFKRKEFENFNTSKHPSRDKILDRFKSKLETASLKTIVNFIDCPIITINSFVDSVIFSHRHLPTYQKTTIIDLLMTRDDAKSYSNAFFLTCLLQYLSGFKDEWSSHWPSLRVVIEKWKMQLSLLQLMVMEQLKNPLITLLDMKIMDKADLTGGAHVAMQSNNGEFFQLLYESSKTVSDGPLSIGNLLIEAIEQKYKWFVPFLLKHEQGIQVDYYYQQNKTPLLAAAKDSATMETLLSHQAITNVDTKDQDGQTPLHIAAHAGNLKVLTMLVEKGARVNAMDNNNFTVLHDAIFSQNNEVITYLLKQGADKDIHVPNKHNETPLKLAQNRRLKGIVGLLKTYDKSEKPKWSPRFLKKRNKHTKS